MKIGNIECKVVIDGHDADEYSEESINGKHKSAWIISESGKPFEFHINVSNEATRLGPSFIYDIYADSILLRCGIKNSKKNTIVINSISSKVLDRPDVVEERPFVFGDIEYVDEDVPDFEMREDVLKQIGQLEVLIWKSKTVSIAPKPQPRNAANRPRPQPTPLPDTAKPIPETKFKGRLLAATHRTELGDATFRPRANNASQPNQRTSKTTKIDPCFAKFVFNYASRTSLQQQDILPYVPAADNGDEDEDDDEDEVVIVGESRQVQERNRQDLDDMTVDQLRDELRRRRVQEDEEDDEDLPHKIKKEKLKEEEAKEVVVGKGKGKRSSVSFYDITGDD